MFLGENNETQGNLVQRQGFKPGLKADSNQDRDAGSAAQQLQTADKLQGLPFSSGNWGWEKAILSGSS